MNVAIAVKALIFNQSNQVLLLQRRSNDVHSPGNWDIPGGRINVGENPLSGLSRECLEETGLEIKPTAPIALRYFERDDGQIITMIIFVCQLTSYTGKSVEVSLSVEHTSYKWVRPKKENLPEWLHQTIDNLVTLKSLQI